MDRRAKVELFEQMRREYEFGVGTIAGVARHFGVHRRLVRQALSSAMPPERAYRKRPSPALDPLKAFVEAILEADRRAPRKQRHTAHRIWVRLRQEHPEHRVAESTLRAYVRERKMALGLVGREVWVPQVYGFGKEAQIDWYEAYADLDGERVKVQVFAMRSMKSGAAFHRAYHRATQQAFFEAHQEAFRYFGGVFRTLRYDNLASAVKRILRGHTRDEHTRFIAFRSHWQFASEFCSPYQPHEKGGIEGEAGYFRRNHFVPVPQAKDLSALNAWLLSACREDEGRVIGERQRTVGELAVEERSHLLPLPAEPFELAEVRSAVVDGKGCVKTHANWYSTPLAAGTRAVVRALPSEVEVWHEGRLVARHERSIGRAEHVLNLEHYLDVLFRKPGAFSGSRPLSQWRERGLWPKSFDRLWETLQARHGKHAGTREMVGLLFLSREHGWEALRRAIEGALASGCRDASAVRYLLLHPDGAAPPAPLTLSELGGLSRYERPLPEMSGYDRLLASTSGGVL
jgi:transposase